MLQSAKQALYKMKIVFTTVLELPVFC
uniref:Uncharacterized protein n=1 Tax=Anguilla anguilla TaxID=7936 RepID=A0A0E9W1H3_ANGAN